MLFWQKWRKSQIKGTIKVTMATSCLIHKCLWTDDAEKPSPHRASLPVLHTHKRQSSDTGITSTGSPFDHNTHYPHLLLDNNGASAKVMTVSPSSHPRHENRLEKRGTSLRERSSRKEHSSSLGGTPARDRCDSDTRLTTYSLPPPPSYSEC
jgi:hypothetical protein